MGLFGKKKEETKSCCCSGGCGCTSASNPGAGVKVLGSGCAKCNALEQAARTALEELGLEPAIDHVTDFAQIAAYGVMSTPALVVEGKVVSTGRVLTVAEAKELIQKARVQG